MESPADYTAPDVWAWSPHPSQLHERHEAGDFDTRTEDKLAAGT